MSESSEKSVHCNNPQHVLYSRKFWRQFGAWFGLTVIGMSLAYFLPSIWRTDAERRGEKTLAMVLAAMERGVVVVNEQGIIELFTPAAEKIFNAKAADVIGMKPGWMVPKEMVKAHRDGWEKFGKSPTSEARIITCTALRWDETEVRIRMRLQMVAQVDGGYKIVAEIEEEKPIKVIELP